MIEFYPGEIIYWIYKNGDKTPCTVIDVLKNNELRIRWHKDGFVNIMPACGFIKGDKNEQS